MSPKHFPVIALAILLVVVAAGIAFYRASHRSAAPSALSTRETTSASSSPIDLALTPLGGNEPIDSEIAEFQKQIRGSRTPNPLLERLGWAFVTKARLTNDPGFYKLAEQCAAAVAQSDPADPEADLLRGHIDHALHRFHDAEAIARKLVATREFVFDYALLGDALMEQGKLTEAVPAYQKMVDLKPCLQTYSRIAHMRWLKGDLAGAIAAGRLAVSSGSPREPEPLAWAATRLGFYLLQQDELSAALTSADEAVHYAPNYAAALLLKGRVLLAQGKAAEAVAQLEKAAASSPLPDYLWTLAEAFRANGDTAKAAETEQKLTATGAANDPRTLSLYLASRGTNAVEAVRLARAELIERTDVFTHDAVAWAELANGNPAVAQAESQKALAEGTTDTRLLYHAGVISAAAGRPLEAIAHLEQAKAHSGTLLPSERADLSTKLASVDRGTANLTLR